METISRLESLSRDAGEVLCTGVGESGETWTPAGDLTGDPWDGNAIVGDKDMVGDEGAVVGSDRETVVSEMGEAGKKGEGEDMASRKDGGG